MEHEVRESLAGQVGRARHPRLDLAGTAIVRARRSRRRRSVVGLAAVLLGTLLATGAVLQDWRGDNPGDQSGYSAVTGQRDGATPGPTPTSTEQIWLADDAVPAEVSADVVGSGGGGLVLATAEGQRLDLAPIRQVDSAYRVGDGWVVVGGDPGTTRLWWVTADQQPKSLLAGMDAIVVQQGQVAYQRGALLATGRLSADGQLYDQVSTAAPQGDGEPVGFVDDAVLMSRTGSTGWDTWHPGRGDYQPTWTDKVIRVYGPLPDGPAAVGLVPPEPGAGACLARLDEELVVSQVSCVTEELPAEAQAAISPQGRWLLASAPEDAVLVDLADVFDPQKRTSAVTALTEVADPAGAPVWLGTDRVVFATDHSLIQLWPDRLRAGADDAVQEIPLLGVAPVLVQPV